MLTIRNEEFVRYEGGKAVVRTVLEITSPAELPASDGLPGRLLHQGSVAWDIVNGSLYGLTAEGEWFIQSTGGGNGEPLNAAILLSRSGAALSADAEAVTPDEPAIQTMSITGFTNGAGTSGQGSNSNRIITQDYYTFPAANILTLSGTKPSGKSLWFEYDYYSYANYSIGYWHGITEGQQVNMSSVQSWWPNYQISKFKLVVGFTDNSAISPSDVTIQMNYKGY